MEIFYLLAQFWHNFHRTLLLYGFHHVPPSCSCLGGGIILYRRIILPWSIDILKIMAWIFAVPILFLVPCEDK